MKRTLLLDENDLIMVVKEDVVKQIDKNRGEMNRTEFVNYLIQCQLREGFNQQDYVTREELQHFTRQILELLRNFLQFFVSYGMALGKKQRNENFEALSQQLESFDKSDEETNDNKYDEDADKS
jgi:BMFP domain-containing protein YqiC